MATTPIGNGSGSLITAELMDTLTRDLADSLTASQRNGTKAAAASAPDATKGINNSNQAVPSTQSAPIRDESNILLSEVATSDLTKLSNILNPTPDAGATHVLDALLQSAVQELAKGNGERAVGYLADYATRDPRRAEALPAQPELEPVRDKIDSMVNRMTLVAKMSAEDGLSRAEQVVTQVTGKISNWETHADVLLKVAHRLFDAGGYANYSRTSELAKVVTDAVTETKPNDQALAASASGHLGPVIATNQNANQFVPGVNVPYWVSPEFQTQSFQQQNRRISSIRGSSNDAFADVRHNWKELKDIVTVAVRQIWLRAPLLVIMLVWLAAGIVGGLGFAVGSRIWPTGSFVPLANFGFNVWATGFLAMVGFGFYARIRDRDQY